MIVSLRGHVVDITLKSAVIECHGVGYEVVASPKTLGTLRRGEETFMLVSMIVREDSQTLYGFRHSDDRDMFALLQSVSGLGPKLAIAIQSFYDAEELSTLISEHDIKGLQKIPGVGKRMAERLIVDLKDKVTSFGSAESEANTLAIDTHSAIADQVLEALVGLGFSEKIAAPILAAVLNESPDITTSAALRATLAALGKNRTN
ncbi:Holliday junction branch migration protein RuvA [Corynebacterium sp. ES2715-CONJ3]|uniref:Holliday junction branch migration protein RuvA n=1 Tax=Corynebacterium sp. ES2715-CONJ3 TaxID=2974028 RepID=UPI0021678889|nr:Holliday junction branch migration protein RuvA [Corynebacterium sp. ES2715-CONJ3]MCS4491037.1 Holliday junction branch migration protein RuvA [Corynebacterium sp. ES2715-CONJ3]